MIFSKKPLANLIGLLIASTSVISQQATAQQNSETTEVERITVHGALTSTPLSEMATSISVLTEEVIQQRQAQHLEDLLNRAANVNFATGASRGRFVQIRGIGERSQFTDPINPSVGFLVDGINYSGLMAGASTFDVQQVEIFKGPNSARFGADGLAGMINVITAEASSDTSLDAQFGMANYGSWNAGAAVGGAISDTVDYRVSLHKNQSDAFVENTFLGRDDTNGIDELTARAKLNIKVTEDLKLKTVLHLIDVDNGYDAFSLNRDRTTLSDEPGFDRQESEALAVKADYQGLDWANLTIQASAMQADLAYGYDEDWSFVGIAPGWEYSSTDYYYRDRDDNSVEIKLSSKYEADNDWVIGFYYSNEEEALEREYTWLSSPFESTVTRKDYALFGQYKHVLSDTQWLTSSLRLASQELTYLDSNLLDRTVNHSDWGGELSYHQNVGDTSMLYLSFVRSYKMGGVNGQAMSKVDDIDDATLRQAVLDNVEFDAESLLGLEFGIKGSNQDGSLTLDFSTFYQKRDDVQYKNSIVKDQSFVDFVENSVNGTNYGLEVSINYSLNESIDVFVNLGYLKTEIKDITRQDGTNIDKRDQAHAPKYHVNGGVNIQLADNLSWLIEVDAKDEFYYSFSHDNKADSMAIAHTSLEYVMQDWSISLYARNLFDKDYANRGFYFPNDPRDEYLPHVWEQFGEPRRVGINVKFQY
ncbi:TonB-dependent receptor [Paraglaciecola aquimarina]|uniref:TonB-dependent receptor n=1 Tax=Paraglaciecola algarum TaxID=3050085 RepID=A0ABS9D2R5_9ALTE|nr:TonB-dependent receptor plug domain-containing protein [Paraglaciecola sp. G1-23]MCF2946894.1 TonB-dependent receptor [Paraglaciecola sp. G1-23]